MLDREKAVDEVRAILVEQLGVDPAEVTVESSFQEDLNADSLDLVELIMEMEDRFKIKIPDEEAEKIATVGQAVDFVWRTAPERRWRRRLRPRPARRRASRPVGGARSSPTARGRLAVRRPTSASSSSVTACSKSS